MQLWCRNHSRAWWLKTTLRSGSQTKKDSIGSHHLKWKITSPRLLSSIPTNFQLDSDITWAACHADVQHLTLLLWWRLNTIYPTCKRWKLCVLLLSFVSLNLRIYELCLSSQSDGCLLKSGLVHQVTSTDKWGETYRSRACWNFAISMVLLDVIRNG